MKFLKEHKKLMIMFLGIGVLELIAAILDGPILAGLMLSLEAFGLWVWLFFRGSEQVLQPRDGLTGLRHIILSFIIASLVVAIPSIVYGTLRYIGLGDKELEILRGIVSVTNGLTKILGPMLLVLVFEYKVEEKKE